MRGIRRVWLLCALLLAASLAGLLVACKSEPEASSAGETPASHESASTAELSEEEDEDPLPPPEAVVLLYTDYLTVRTVQDGLTYEYTYCFDAEQNVFNAVAVIDFPTEEAAGREYDWLRRNSYPNLQLEGTTLSFCFPKKECPFYGISYRALEVLLEETVYEIVDRHPPEPPEPPEDSSDGEEK